MRNIEKLVSEAMARLASADGQTMTEYALLVVFIAMAVTIAVQLLGTNLLGLFTSAAGAL